MPATRFRSAALSASALSLLRFLPLPNLDGTSRNFHYVTTNDSVSDSINLRVTHNFTPNAGGRGGPGGRGGGGRGGPGARGGGRAGRGQQGTSVNMTTQLQYRRNDNDQVNVFPTLGGQNIGSSLTVPVSLNIQHRRTSHSVNVNFSRTSSQSLNQYAYVEDVAGAAGITGVATDPFDWGVPQLSFSSLSSLRDVTPSRRTDKRFSLAYAWTRPFTRHTLRLGGDFRLDDSDNQTDNNARGAFVFTGLYASGGSASARGGGLDFADFLLGLPQQATVQYGPGNVRMSGRSLSAFLQDDWRKSSDADVQPRRPLRADLAVLRRRRSDGEPRRRARLHRGGAGALGRGGSVHGTVSQGAAQHRLEQHRAARRRGLADEAGDHPPRGLRRQLQRRLVFDHRASARRRSRRSRSPTTASARRTDPLSLSDPFAGASPAETTNNYGVDRNYVLGLVQTVNADLSRDIRQVWNVGGGYTHTRGASLDIVRAPNRGPDGLRIEGVAAVRVADRGRIVGPARRDRSASRAGRSRVSAAALSYTLAKSRDNASSIGGGGTNVAQDDQNLAAEWGLSSFDRRHQLSTNLSVELPFGPNRPWLAQPGVWQTLLRDWRFATTFTWQSGTPYTARVTGAVERRRAGHERHAAGELRRAADLARRRDDRSVLQHQRVHACRRPGTFGTASRNLIIGPGSKLLNAQISRDVRLGGNRVVSLQLNANNLLNLVNYAGIDTVVNSPTFGQVLSVRPMRSMTLNLRFRYLTAVAASRTVRCGVGAAGPSPPRPCSSRASGPGRRSRRPRPVFRSNLNVVSVDVIVRDKSGAVVRGLTAADFEIREDGRPQTVDSFTFEEITEKPLPALETADLLAGVEAKMAEDAGRAPAPPRLEARAGRRPDAA